MTSILTYLDSGVLFAGSRGNDLVSVNVDEFITTEKTTKPLHRVTQIKVISSFP